jgi:hypothetical protein
MVSIGILSMDHHLRMVGMDCHGFPWQSLRFWPGCMRPIMSLSAPRLGIVVLPLFFWDENRFNWIMAYS